MIRLCTHEDVQVMCDIINDAARAYRGVIPADCCHEPYLPMQELEQELVYGVNFWGYDTAETGLVGVMGIQNRGEVQLIRHAYVRTRERGSGIGTALIRHLQSVTTAPLLVGTWAAAQWAVRFYERHGFQLVSTKEKDRLLRRFWKIPARQIETSVVLGDDAWMTSGDRRMF